MPASQRRHRQCWSCLKWDANGELLALDHARLIDVLRAVDQELHVDHHCDLAEGPGAAA